MKNIVVIFGGESVEHDISIITGLGVVRNLSSEYNPIAVYIDSNGKWWTGEKLKSVESFKNWNEKGIKQCAFLPGESSLTIFSRFIKKNIQVHCVVNCLHGRNGEDGCVQGALRIANLPSTSDSVLSSALCMNKSMTKHILKHSKIKVVEEVLLTDEEYQNSLDDVIKKVDQKIKFPCIVKPNNLGSSVGVGVANNEEELRSSIEVALSFDREVLIEKFLSNAREFNIAVTRNDKVETSNIEEVVRESEIYEFKDKYENKKIKRQVPANIPENIKEEIEKCAVLAYNKLKCTGIVRVDFLMMDDKIYFNELNTIPGSLSGYLWKEPKISYKSLLTKLIENSVKRFKKEGKYNKVFNSNVLKNLSDESFKMSK